LSSACKIGSGREVTAVRILPHRLARHSASDTAGNLDAAIDAVNAAMVGTGVGSELRQPLGYTIVGGLLLS
jgi:hypothetical protein